MPYVRSGPITNDSHTQTRQAAGECHQARHSRVAAFRRCGCATPQGAQLWQGSAGGPPRLCTDVHSVARQRLRAQHALELDETIPLVGLNLQTRQGSRPGGKQTRFCWGDLDLQARQGCREGSAEDGIGLQAGQTSRRQGRAGELGGKCNIAVGRCRGAGRTRPRRASMPCC